MSAPSAAIWLMLTLCVGCAGVETVPEPLPESAEAEIRELAVIAVKVSEGTATKAESERLHRHLAGN